MIPEMMPSTACGRMFLSDMANAVCKHLPEGWEISLAMENGAAWVTLETPAGDYALLPDQADKTLEEQINDALCVANGWRVE